MWSLHAKCVQLKWAEMRQTMKGNSQHNLGESFVSKAISVSLWRLE